ncbi:hypothetical protein NIES2111_66450 (plasmid) [Nostoc sp. NIES-2111]|nr:hypothetical protein NIES2111_66450 [Nostoc sp. NIES-2111]
MSNSKFTLATAKILRSLYEVSALNSKGQFCNGWQYRCRNLVSELAYFSEVEDKVHFVCNLREAKMFCKFSEAAWSIVQGQTDNTYLRENKGVTHGEHIVPISLVQRIAFKMLSEGASDEKIANMLSNLVEIVFITKNEKALLDSSIRNGGYGLKTTMPPGWNQDIFNHDWSNANRYARLEIAGIKLAQATINNSLNSNFTLIS